METKIEELKTLLAAADKIAAELVQDKYQGRSAALCAVRSRLTGAEEMLAAHEAWCVANPKPAA